MLQVNWEQFSAFIFYKEGFDQSAGNVCSYKSRFLIVKRWFDSNLRDFSGESVLAFVRYVHDVLNASPSTENKYIVTLRKIARILKLPDAIADLKSRREEVPMYDTLSSEEQDRFVAAVPSRHQFDILQFVDKTKYTNEFNHRMKTLFRFQLANGLRTGELRNLKWSDWYGDHFKVYATNTRKHRVVVVLPSLAKDVEKLHRYAHGFVFGTERGPMDQHSVNREIRERLTIAEIHKPDYSLRKLRATSATSDLRAGVKLEVVAKKLGHKNIQMTFERYYKSIIDDLIDAAHLNPVNSPDLTLNVVRVMVRKLVDLIPRGLFKLTHEETATRIKLVVEMPRLRHE